MKRWFILSVFFSLGLPFVNTAQTIQRNCVKDAKTGITVSTKITERKPLEQEIQELKAVLTEARKNPQRVQDGTVLKCEQALAKKTEQHRKIEQERARRVKLTNSSDN